ncbi:hypothetical protein CFP56_018241 [Quercus suber]|uniref:Uncharacterized protein n=1 Tax=Quercus suber TaxID=58331 RepID=A0AAW0KMM0_QUESU
MFRHKETDRLCFVISLRTVDDLDHGIKQRPINNYSDSFLAFLRRWLSMHSEPSYYRYQREAFSYTVVASLLLCFGIRGSKTYFNKYKLFGEATHKESTEKSRENREKERVSGVEEY